VQLRSFRVARNTLKKNLIKGTLLFVIFLKGARDLPLDESGANKILFYLGFLKLVCLIAKGNEVFIE